MDGSLLTLASRAMSKQTCGQVQTRTPQGSPLRSSCPSATEPRPPHAGANPPAERRLWTARRHSFRPSQPSTGSNFQLQSAPVLPLCDLESYHALYMPPPLWGVHTEGPASHPWHLRYPMHTCTQTRIQGLDHWISPHKQPPVSAYMPCCK